MNETVGGNEEALRAVIKSLNQDIRASWIRCLNEYHLTPSSIKKPEVVTRAELKKQAEPIQELLGISCPKIEVLFDKFMDKKYFMSVSSREGGILNFRGDLTLSQQDEGLGFVAGSVWSEDRQGTNGVGTSIYLKRPVSVIRREHFDQRYHDWTCTSVPVFGPGHELQCTINATTDKSTDHEGQALLRSILIDAARRIENAFFMHKFQNQRILRISLDSSFIDTANEACLAVSDAGLVTDATSPLETILKTDREKIINRQIEDVLALNLDAMSTNQSTFSSSLHPSVSNVYSLLCEDRPLAHRPFDPAGFQRPKQILSESFVKSVFALHPQLVLSYERAKRLIRAGLPVVLRAEEGSGREDFARLLGEEVFGSGLTIVRGGIDTIEKISSLLTPSGMRGAYYLENASELPTSLAQSIGRIVSAQIKFAETPKFAIMIGCSKDSKESAVVCKCCKVAAEDVDFPAVRSYPNVRAVVERLLDEQKKISDQDNKQFNSQALQVLSSYFWEGNLQQIRFVIRYALTVSQEEIMGLNDLPENLLGPLGPVPRDTSSEAADRETLIAALNFNKWNVSQTASYLGLSRATLNRRIRKLGIKRPANGVAGKEAA